MFFDNNLGFITLETDFTMPNLFTANQGFIRGNMFQNDFVGYKNYEVVNPKAKTEKEGYLYKIMELEFCINDLNLYLDLNPNSSEVYKIMQQYVNELLQTESEYISKFGPLEICDVTSDNFEWINNWPWEGESKYV